MGAKAIRDERSQNGRGLLLMEEAAALARVPLSTLRWWVQTGKLAGSVRAGKRRLIPVRALAQALGVEPADLG